MDDKEHEVRERAYSIWEEQGKPDGLHKTHWDAALKELGLKDPGDTTAIVSGVVDVGAAVAPPPPKRGKGAKGK
jgi:hypothetical protein